MPDLRNWCGIGEVWGDKCRILREKFYTLKIFVGLEKNGWSWGEGGVGAGSATPPPSLTLTSYLDTTEIAE